MVSSSTPPLLSGNELVRYIIDFIKKEEESLFKLKTTETKLKTSVGMNNLKTELIGLGGRVTEGERQEIKEKGINLLKNSTVEFSESYACQI